MGSFARRVRVFRWVAVWVALCALWSGRAAADGVVSVVVTFKPPIVTPNADASTEGSGADNFLPGSACGQQQLFVIDASQFSALTTGDYITGFAFRPDVNLCPSCTSFASTTIHNVTIRLATTTKSASDLSDGTYADFLTTNLQTVSSGDVTVSSGDSGPAEGPKAFDIAFPFDTHWYSYDPASGNLVVQLVIDGIDGIPEFIDAAQGSSVASRIFGCASGPFSSAGIHDNTGPAVMSFSIVNITEGLPAPTLTPTNTPTSTPTPTNTATQTPTSTPTDTPTPPPTDTPTPVPTSTGTPAPTPTVKPSAEICRVASFWGTHARFDPGQPRSRNMTSAAILAGGGCLDICGEVISPTAVSLSSPGCSGTGNNFKCPKIGNDAESAVEALCVPSNGDRRLQLARQLTAAALNCAVSNGSSDCAGVSVETVFQACNAACAAAETAASVNGATVDCVAAVACFNQGGQFDSAAGTCQLGTCSTKKKQPCGTGFAACPSGTSCVRPVGNCRDALFGTCSDPPSEGKPAVLCGASIDPGTGPGTCADASPCKTGPGGSSGDCSAANSSACTVIEPAEAKCVIGNMCTSSESCCDATACPACVSGDTCSTSCP